MKDGHIIQTDTAEGMSSNPANDYVENFINSADKAQIYTVQYVMENPSCLIHSRDGSRNELTQMRAQSVSSAYVVGDDLEFVGILTLDQAIRVKNGDIAFQEAITKDLPTTTADTQISELIPRCCNRTIPYRCCRREYSSGRNCYQGICPSFSCLELFNKEIIKA